ncbi:HEPN domain-containing protein [bacterium 1XD42-1]|nr:HEPN domain-containing protein [bacterium 1XD42-8]RKJ67260.1 HEPN domain-containing protein [bacterium 1XD42-1]
MPNERDLAGYRLEKAFQCLTTAQSNLTEGDCCASVNRSYYAVFHGMRAVLALDHFDSKKHSGIISEFRKQYIKTGIFPVELSDMLSQLFQVRNNSDYMDFYIVSKADAEQQVKNASIFLKEIDRYLKGRDQ